MAACFPYLHEQLALVQPTRHRRARQHAPSRRCSRRSSASPRCAGQWKLYRGSPGDADLPPVLPPAPEPPAGRGEEAGLGGPPAGHEGARPRAAEEEGLRRPEGAEGRLSLAIRPPFGGQWAARAPHGRTDRRARPALEAEPEPRRRPSRFATRCGRARARPLVQQVGEFATQRHAADVGVLISVARMYMEAHRFGDAQAAWSPQASRRPGTAPSTGGSGRCCCGAGTPIGPRRSSSGPSSSAPATPRRSSGSSGAGLPSDAGEGRERAPSPPR